MCVDGNLNRAPNYFNPLLHADSTLRKVELVMDDGAIRESHSNNEQGSTAEGVLSKLR